MASRDGDVGAGAAEAGGVDAVEAVARRGRRTGRPGGEADGADGADRAPTPRPPARWIAAGWLFVALAWTPASALVNATSVTPSVLAMALGFNLLNFGLWAAATPALFRLCARHPLGGGGGGGGGGRDAARNVALLALAGVVVIPAITLTGSLVAMMVDAGRDAGAGGGAAAGGGASARLASRVLITSLFAVPTYIAVIAIGQTWLWARRAGAHARDAAGAELRALRAELNPHFLFNTLGAIARLAHAAPDRAEAAIGTLSRVLRASLTDAGPTQTVADAIGEIEEHLALYRTLHGPIRFDRRVDDALWARPLPTRVLLPLVENAMTHGAMDEAGARWLALRIAAADGGMAITLDNPVPATARPSPGLGSGLEASRRLLALHHGARATLTHARSDGRFRVVLRLPA